MKNNYLLNYNFCSKLWLEGCKGLERISKIVLVSAMMLTLTTSGLEAQVSGTWNSNVTTGTTGYTNWGNGVEQLLSSTVVNCVASAVHKTAVTYNPTSGTAFSASYQIYFGCPGGNDNIGSDTKGDGMAFSFWKSTATYNIGNGLACGGGLGYMGSASDGKMLSIEFDVYDSQCNSNFDCHYGGTLTTGNHDEISLHINQDASDAGLLPNSSVDAGNLEDGLEHKVDINYNPTTHILTVAIDGNTKLTYNFSVSSPANDPVTYFGNVGLNQTWSAGQNGAFDPSTVNDGDGTLIIPQLGGAAICNPGVVINSPTTGSAFDPCNGPITITASATAPAGKTISYIDFLVDGTSVGTDNTAPYSMTTTPTTGSHSLTAVAHFSDGSTVTTSTPTTITMGAIELTSTAPVIDGVADAVWSSYPSFTMSQYLNASSAPNLASSFKVMYDATYLYVLVNITDNTPNIPNWPATTGNYWNDDGAEIYIDCGNTKQTSYNATDFQYAMVRSAASPVLETKHGAAAVGAVTTNAAGYIVEMKFLWTTLGCSPTPGTNLGFDVSINDNGSGGGRTNQLAWHDNTQGEWNNPSLFGTLPFSNCNPLPVNLLTFTGKMINETTVLNWVTTSERNNKEFIIERSSDLTNWISLGAVTGAGNAASLTNYSFTDYSPLSGIGYYRLVQVDMNGAMTYSNVVEVQQTRNPSINIAPNPFDNVLSIQSNATGAIDISIFDVLGRLVYHSNQDNNNGTLVINPDLSSGSYIITVQSGSFIEHQKIIRK
jgi:hypothetical protein